jgi:hypothetical protein
MARRHPTALVPAEEPDCSDRQDHAPGDAADDVLGLIALVLTVLATVVLLLHMPTVSSLADLARVADGAALRRLGGDLLHPSLGLVVLLVITVLNVYMPRG